MIAINAVWIVPIVLTIGMLIAMCRPLESTSDFGAPIEALFRMFWCIPILAVWLLFFAIMYFAG